MTSNAFRKEVLKTFKNLHRTSRFVFKNNKPVLDAAIKEINSEYKKYKHVSNEDSIKELIRLANDVVFELETTVAELEETRPGQFRLNLRPEMFKDRNHAPLKKLTK